MWNKATKAKCSVEQHHKITVGYFEMIVSADIDVAKDNHDCFFQNSGVWNRLSKIFMLLGLDGFWQVWLIFLSFSISNLLV